LKETELLELFPLLRDPRAIVQHVELDWCITYFGNPDEIPANSDALRAIAASLAQNTKLKRLDFLLIGSRVRFPDLVDDFDNLFAILPILKTFPIQTILFKILNFRTSTSFQYCFVGDFDLSQFASMPLSVVTEVMGLGEGMGNKQSVIFELLRTIPGLCNVSGRSVPR
jgi:hypothetical protein